MLRHGGLEELHHAFSQAAEDVAHGRVVAGVPPDDLRLAEGAPQRLGAGRRNHLVVAGVEHQHLAARQRPGIGDRVDRPSAAANSDFFASRPIRPSACAAGPSRSTSRPLRPCRRRPAASRPFVSRGSMPAASAAGDAAQADAHDAQLLARRSPPARPASRPPGGCRARPGSCRARFASGSIEIIRTGESAWRRSP